MGTPVGLVLENCRVLTMRAPAEVRDRLCIAGGRIVRRPPSGARRVDLAGAVVLPGLCDAHCHLLAHALQGRELDCAAGSIAELQDRVRAGPGSGWIVGSGWDQERLGRMPERRDLDIVARPVVLRRVCRHVAVANSAALSAAGLQRPDGLLYEAEVAAVTGLAPPPDAAERRLALAGTAVHALDCGLTSVHSQDAWAPGEVGPALRLWRSLERAPRAYLLWPAGAEGCRTGAGDDRVRLGPAKVFADGSLGAHTAALSLPYADRPDTSGRLLHEQEELDAVVRRAVLGGSQVAIHAIGDRALDAALDACERAGASRRHRLVHLQVVRPDQFARLRTLGLIADLQPRFAVSDSAWWPGRLGPERLTWGYPLERFVAERIPACGGSDCPVEPLNPWPSVAAAAERLGAWEALRLFTTGAAYAEFAAGRKGCLLPGALADAVLLDRDPLACAPQELASLRPLGVLLGGEPVRGL